MKHTIIAIAVLIAASSCSKNKKYCWQCTNKTTVTVNSNKPVVTTTKNDICDKTEADMASSNSYTADTVKYGDTMTVVSIHDLSCSKL